MSFDFHELIEHLQEFRRTADEISNFDHTSCEAVQSYFLRLLMVTSRIYLDSIEFTAALPALYASRKGRQEEIIRSDLDREREYREWYRGEVESLPWQYFSKEKSMRLSTLTLLKTIN